MRGLPVLEQWLPGWLGVLSIGLSACASPVLSGAGDTPPILVGAGDIVECDEPGAEMTAQLLDEIPGTVFTLGDNVYEAGTADEFARCYDPTWGRHRSRTRPAVGNHDYDTPDAAGYFGYFGAAAGDPEKGYYSYDLDSWHVVVLNTQICWTIDCDGTTPQEQWLRADLAAHQVRCTLVYGHLPRFTSGEYQGPAYEMEPIWRILYDAGVDVMLSGHEHSYERFAPQDPTGALDPQQGIRQFVVGTGGRDFYPLGEPLPNSEVRNAETFGVLKLTLHRERYEWEFVAVPGSTFSDAGSASCH